MPASSSPWSAARRRHSAPPMDRPHGHDRVVLGGELVERALDGGDPVGPVDLVEVLPARAVPGQQRHLDGVAAGGEVLGPRPHGDRVAGEAVLHQHADAAPAGELGPRGSGHRRDQCGVEGRRRRAAERDLHAHSVHHCLLRIEVRTRADAAETTARVPLTRDDARRREPHRAGVARDRGATTASAPCSTTTTPSDVAPRRRPLCRVARRRAPAATTPTQLPDDRVDDDEVEIRERAIAEAERFRPPPRRPFPVPRTWQRGLAWAGIFVAPAPRARDRRCSRSTSHPLVGWALVGWFVGGFAYLVHEMPRVPRDPWDDGSRI